jgi:succinoglycan biosynthesis transport protein ExoP
MQSLPGNASIAVATHGNAYMRNTQDHASMRNIVEAAFRHRSLWILVAGSVFFVAIAYTVLRPKEYQSEMDILVQNTRGDEQITPSRVNGTITINGVTEEQINSEIQLLQSRGLANLVVDPQWNSASTSMTPDQLKAHEKAVDKFEKHLSVQMIRKSNVIHATYLASDPRAATEALSRLLAAFLAKQREIAQPPGTAKFFADEADRYKDELDQAQQQLAEYQQQHQIVSLPDTEQNVDREINDAETELRSTDAQISEVTQRIGTQTRQLKDIPSRQLTQQRVAPNEYSVEQLTTMLATLQNDRTSLLTKFTPEDRSVQEVDKKIADTKTALANAQRLTSQDTASDVNPVWQAVSGSIIQGESDRQSLRAKHDALAQQIGSLRASLSTTEGSTVAFTTLRQKVTDLENNYQLYTQKRDEAQMADAMNQSRLLNVAIQQNPTFSVIPFRPKPVVDTVLGGFTAIFLASFLVFFAEVGRDTIANAGELERLTWLPVFATVPRESLGTGRRAEARSEFSPVIIGMARGNESANERKASPVLVRNQREGRFV